MKHQYVTLILTLLLLFGGLTLQAHTVAVPKTTYNDSTKTLAYQKRLQQLKQAKRAFQNIFKDANRAKELFDLNPDLFIRMNKTLIITLKWLRLLKKEDCLT